MKSLKASLLESIKHSDFRMLYLVLTTICLYLLLIINILYYVFMTHQNRILAAAKTLGVIRPRDINAPRSVFAELVKKRLLEKTGRGMYQIPTADLSEHHSLVEVSTKVPQGVISLLSALQFHNIGTQNPHEIWITVDVRARRPKLVYPPIRVMRASTEPLRSGVEFHKIEGRKIPIYSIEKTIIDCFKYRNKVGLDVALEALKDAWQKRRINMDALWKYAQICRVTNVIRPYIEAVQ